MSLSKPSVSQLCEALSEFIADELAPQISSSELSYKLKIALNILDIIAREAEQGPQFSVLEQGLLAEFLGTPGDTDELNARLSEQITVGQFDGKEGQLIAVLERITLSKMAIDNPRYSSYKKRILS